MISRLQISRLLSSATENVTSAELTFAEDKIQKSYERHKKYMKDIPKKIKHARNFGTASAIKKFTIKYPKYSFVRTTVNSWKKKYEDGKNVVIKKIGRPNLLDSSMLKK